MTLSISVLGPLIITANGSPLKIPKKVAALLAYLAIEDGGSASREVLADLLWPYNDSVQSRHSLRNCLLTFHRAIRNTTTLERSPIIASINECSLRDYATDKDEFDLVLNSGDVDRAAALYRGPFLWGIHIRSESWQEWLHITRERIQISVVNALQSAGQRALEEGNSSRAISLAELVLNIDKSFEGAYRHIIMAHKLAGRPSAAVKAFRQCAIQLNRDLSVDPDNETIELIKVFQNKLLPPTLKELEIAELREYERGKVAGYRLAISDQQRNLKIRLAKWETATTEEPNTNVAPTSTP